MSQEPVEWTTHLPDDELKRLFDVLEAAMYDGNGDLELQYDVREEMQRRGFEARSFFLDHH
jgi:hypothetical protein